MSANSELRGAVIADLVRSLDGHLVDHRQCAGLAGSVLETTADGAPWGVAWLCCPDCGVKWERRLALSGAA